MQSTQSPQPCVVILLSLSRLFMSLGMGLVLTPFLYVYQTVLCCPYLEHQEGQCPWAWRDLNEAECRKVPAVQHELNGITAGLTRIGAFGIVVALFWLRLAEGYHRKCHILSLAAFGSVLAEISQALLAYTNGAIPLRHLQWISPLISFLVGGGGITFAILYVEITAESVQRQQRPTAMLLLDSFGPSLCSIAGNHLVSLFMETWGAWWLLVLGLSCQLLSVVATAGLWISPETGPQSALVDVQSRLSFRDQFRLVAESLRKWDAATILGLILSLSYSPLQFAASTLAIESVVSRYDSSMKCANHVVMISKLGPILVILYEYLRLVDLVTSKGQVIHKSLGALSVLWFIGICANIILGRAGTRDWFSAGLFLEQMALAYPSYSKSILTTGQAAEGGSSMWLLWVEQLIEAVGRFFGIDIISGLYARGREYDIPGLPYYGLAGVCFIFLVMVLWVSRSPDDGSASSSEEPPNSTSETGVDGAYETDLLIDTDLMEAQGYSSGVETGYNRQ